MQYQPRRLKVEESAYFCGQVTRGAGLDGIYKTAEEGEKRRRSVTPHENPTGGNFPAS